MGYISGCRRQIKSPTPWAYHLFTQFSKSEWCCCWIIVCILSGGILWVLCIGCFQLFAYCLQQGVDGHLSDRLFYPSISSSAWLQNNLIQLHDTKPCIGHSDPWMGISHPIAGPGSIFPFPKLRVSSVEEENDPQGWEDQDSDSFLQ